MIGDYEDDTHFCLKCHLTIIGLDNYVNHRKTGCSKSDVPKSPLPSQLLPPDESFGLKADDFFSSLELQSSSKKTAQSTSGKNSGILTRSKTTAAIQANINLSKDELPQSKSGKNVWIGGHQLKLGCGDNQSKLIKAVDNLERRKEEPSRMDVFEESDVDSEDYDYDVSSSDEENHDAPPKNHTGGKWKPSSPISWNRNDWNVPPPNYTGGKWKPISKRNLSPPPSHTKGKWKPTDTLSANYNTSVPPSITGGKWSQSKSSESNSYPKVDPTSTKTKCKTKSQISPSYTRGKWLPQSDTKKVATTKITDDSPFRKSSGTVQYWCRPCSRRLSSKLVYERHLKSELHFKRTLHDSEFEDINVVKEKRNKKKLEVTTSNENVVKIESKETKRKRKKIYLRCEVCKSKVNNALMGKHLISHYHCRKGDLSSSAAKKIVLDNIKGIILQSPFQCSICKFYFNFHKDFLNHWLSEDHVLKQKERLGYFWCSLCKFKHEDNDGMHKHLISKDHKEVVAVINRSMPIVIKKINPVYCSQCNERFLLNIQLIKHCQRENHEIQRKFSSDDYVCLKCDQIFKSSVSLKTHRQNVHKETNVFICSYCDVSFNSIQEAKLHRNSLEHRHRVLARKHPNAKKSCEYCKQQFDNFLELKKHLRNDHPEYCPRCPQCGMTFSISQDLTVHLRTNSCKFKENSSCKNTCNLCLFSTDSQSEFLFHQALHTDPLIIYAETEKKKPLMQYKCPLCKKLYPKASLQAHLRLHTKERPFVCTICKKSFVRKNNWLFHVRNHEKKKVKQNAKTKEIAGKRPFLCSTCGASFMKKSILNQHLIIHSGKFFKCNQPGCITTTRSMSELKIHLQTHSDDKNFACTICEYKGKTKQQLVRHLTVHDLNKKYQCTKCAFSTRTSSHLKRHTRLHTGSKPYSCPHCKYKCNNLENLRKHILSTNKHKGKSIYHCKFCSKDQFQSNFAKDFKIHLVMKHSEMFEDGAAAATYVSGIYDANLDNQIKSNSEGSSSRGNKLEVIPSTSSGLINKDRCERIIIQDEIFPMFVVSKDVVASQDSSSEIWNLVATYDVDESDTLIPFHADTGVIFQEHFE